MNGQLYGRTVRLVVAFFSLCAFYSLAEPLPNSSFSHLPQFEKPRLSPLGTKIAFIHNRDSAEPLTLLGTVDLVTGERHFLLQSDNRSIKINWYRWANEETLIVSARYESRARNTKFYETRMYAMAFNGGEPRLLIKPKGSTARVIGGHVSQFQDDVIDWLPGDPDHIMVAVDLERPNMPSVYKINVNTSRRSRIEKGKMQVRDWITDRQGRLRVGISLDYQSGERNILVRRAPDEDADWDKIYTYNTMNEAGIYPLGFAADPNIMYYKAYLDDKLALYTWNLSNDEKTLVYADPDYDVSGSLIYSTVTNDAIGVRHSNTELGRVYWDERFMPLQNSFDRIFEQTDNYLVSFDQNEVNYILYTEADNIPGVYYIGNREDKSLSVLFEQYPSLQPEVLGEHTKVAYTARDGLQIEGYLTIPAGSKAEALPMLIHPHGGPGARDYAGFDYWTSFFNNLGYAVFRPNFRGSEGYGYSFAQSQMQRWGLEMQDDLTDAAHWLIEQGIADPQRLCIVGASYGGYAVNMAAVKSPDLFKCGISFAGVSDLKTLVRGSRRFLNTKFVKNQIGEDSNDLEARSPYYQVEKVKMPLLLIHGDEDRIVNVRQSRMLASELEDHNKAFEYIELEDGDHYLSIQQNRHKTFEVMANFLQKHIGKREE